MASGTYHPLSSFLLGFEVFGSHFSVHLHHDCVHLSPEQPANTGTCKVKTIHYILWKMQVKSFGHGRTGKRR